LQERTKKISDVKNTITMYAGLRNLNDPDRLCHGVKRKNCLEEKGKRGLDEKKMAYNTGCTMGVETDSVGHFGVGEITDFPGEVGRGERRTNLRRTEANHSRTHR